ncbi:MAG: hypothetical protein EON93_01095 [Burkholderiales bacterium]|nr:MAG: hypothetical protein EON93_01095 [Burkholderiales bacterium]
MDDSTKTAYQTLLQQAMGHGSETSRDIAAILLNSYNYNLPSTGFAVGRFRHFDESSRRAVLRYLEWLGSASGLYPPSEDMDALKAHWANMGWGDLN